MTYVRRGLPSQIRGDRYHYLVTSSWPVVIFAAAWTFFLINLAFACVYMAFGGIQNARSFGDYFFFAVETMATIGYGKLVPVSSAANIVMSIQALTGLTWLAVMTGLVFSKFSRPRARVRFSRNAVIAYRDGVPSLMLRMANERTDEIVEALIHVVLARDELTLEGEDIRRIHDLEMVRERNAFFSLSWTAVHQITEASPLYGATAESLAESAAEIAVSLVGLDEGLAQTIHARHVYEPGQIIFGARFADLFKQEDDKWVMDLSGFDDIEPSDWEPPREWLTAGAQSLRSRQI